MPGTDYTAPGSSVSFAARGATSADLSVDPISLAPVIKGGRSVTATLSPPDDKATVIINSSTNPTGTGLLVRFYDTAAAVYANSVGHTHGFHPSCPQLQTLFSEDRLAVVFNVGTLVRPTTRAQYTSGLAAYRPPQLFSHSDQVTQWQTSIPDQPPTTGWGGRVADLIDLAANPSGGISMSVSASGANTFEVGNWVALYQVSTSGAAVLTGDALMSSTGARARAQRASPQAGRSSASNRSRAEGRFPTRP